MKILGIWGIIMGIIGVLATLTGLGCLVATSLGADIFGQTARHFAMLFLLGLCILLVLLAGAGLGHRYLPAKDLH